MEAKKVEFMDAESGMLVSRVVSGDEGMGNVGQGS